MSMSRSQDIASAIEETAQKLEIVRAELAAMPVWKRLTGLGLDRTREKHALLQYLDTLRRTTCPTNGGGVQHEIMAFRDRAK